MKTVFSFLSFLSICAFSQVGIGTENPHPNSLLDLSVSGKGLLLPRVELSSTSDFAPLSSHVEGIIVFNTLINNDVSIGFYYNNGSSWVKLTENLTRIGDVKHGFQASDHDGWFLLDGRPISNISSAVARENATSLGLVNLPNASDRFLKSRNGSELVGSLGGVSSVILSRQNLPNISFPVTFVSSGEHFHNYVDNGTTTRTAGTGTNNPIASTTNGNFSTNTTGAHTHTFSVNSGGTSSPINYSPSYLTTNVFVFLGN